MSELLIAERIATPRTAAEYARAAREISTADSVVGLRDLRLAVLSSCSFQFAESALVVEGARRRMRLRTFYGPFGQFEQQITDPSSALHDFDAEALVLFMRPEDLDPDAYARFHARPGEKPFGAVVDRLIACVEAFRARSGAPVLVANFAGPAHGPLGPFDANVAASLGYALTAANAELQARLSKVGGAIVWDYAGLVRSAGAETWSDPRLWALARIPIASDRQPVLARHLARTLAGVLTTPAKCLVLDLDNTVWGGVIGDDGIAGIQLGDDYPGNVFKSFQRAALGLADRGILLAVVSKNDQEVVDRALREHPEMLIRQENLSAMRVNWEPKSQNLREIAKELNIGLDALVMFDDNPVERAEIAANAPEVGIVDVPTDPLGYERALHECGFFDTPSLSDEDRQRVQMYRVERARDEVRATTHSIEEFLAGLDMQVEVGRADSASIGRIAQLVGKTNQFNMTTRRHSQADITRMAADPTHDVIHLRVRDRFGDLGLVAVAIVEFRNREAHVDSFLMSCRAMGRQVEVALAAEIVSAARARGCDRVVGEYLPTPRNNIVAGLYATLGFASDGSVENGGERFALDLTSANIDWPPALRRLEPVAAVA